jgi:hypothetical protein
MPRLSLAISELALTTSASHLHRIKGSGALKDSSGSEEDEDSEELFLQPMGRPSNAKKSREIPNIPPGCGRFYGSGTCASAPVAIHHPIERRVGTVDLTTGTVISRMKKIWVQTDIRVSTRSY